MSLYASLPVLLLGCVVGSVQAETFDYVIAGAGTAGLVIANRLSEQPHVTVAVVEAGPDVRDDPGVRSIHFNVSRPDASVEWEYFSTPAAPALGSRSFQYRAGKAIGGSTTVNGIYLLLFPFFFAYICYFVADI